MRLRNWCMNVNLNVSMSNVRNIRLSNWISFIYCFGCLLVCLYKNSKSTINLFSFWFQSIQSFLLCFVHIHDSFKFNITFENEKKNLGIWALNPSEFPKNYLLLLSKKSILVNPLSTTHIHMVSVSIWSKTWIFSSQRD